MKVRCGFEWHVQLDTKKLFCSCPSIVEDEAESVEIKRRFKASMGEKGSVDITAGFEESKGNSILYEAPLESSCLVEVDEEPPHGVNYEALKIGLEMANSLRCRNIFDSIIFMRKVIVDGSNTSGFQRTALIAMDGGFEFEGKEIEIATINIEEDSARRIKEEGGVIEFRLDRLGIPLVEIATKVIETDESEAKRIAEEFGRFTRLFKVRRGIGTIRQDINLSIEGGSRVEIKGFQDIRHMDKAIKNEAERQGSLLKIIEEKGHLIQYLDNYVEISLNELLSETKSEVIKKGIDSNKLVIGLGLTNFSGVFGQRLCDGKRFGTEVSDYLRAMLGLGIIHSDELPGYGITEEEVDRIKNAMGLTDKDAFLISVIDRDKKVRVIESIISRIRSLLRGVPAEVRTANLDDTSSFLRPIGGEDRMYIETDLPIISVPKEILEDAHKFKNFNLKTLKAEYGLNDNALTQLIGANKLDLAIKLNRELGIDFNVIIKVLIEDMKYIKRKLSIDLDDKAAVDTLRCISENRITEEASTLILEKIALNEIKGVEEGIDELNLRKLTGDELKREIIPILKDYKPDERTAIIKLKEKLGPRFDYKEAMDIISNINGNKRDNKKA
ncbi:MAG: Glu-tRNA(Gln) amidotransferase subunit GatE [Candidatus Micrarchaeaceae archaeon]